MAVRRLPYGLQNPMQRGPGVAYRPGVGISSGAFLGNKPPPAPKAPPAPRAPGTGGTNAAPGAGGSLASLGVPAAGGTPAVDPRDATYWQDVIALNYGAEGGLQQDENAIVNAGITRTRALEDLAKGHASGGRDLRENYASKGLGVSTASAQGLGEFETGYATNVNRTNESTDRFIGQARAHQDLLRRGLADQSGAALRGATERAAQNAPPQYSATPYLSASAPAQVAGTYKLTANQKIALTNALRKAKTPAEKQIISEKLYGFRPY